MLLTIGALKDVFERRVAQFDWFLGYDVKMNQAVWIAKQGMVGSLKTEVWVLKLFRSDYIITGSQV